MYDDNGISKGYGFVQFDTQEAAGVAIVNGNGITVLGQKIEVTKFMSRSEREATGPLSDLSATNLFIKNIPEGMNEDALFHLFAPFGEVTSHVVMRDPGTGKSRQFGFVNFSNPDSATQVSSSEVISAILLIRP